MEVTKPIKWTKKEIKAVQGSLDSFWLFNRLYYPAKAIAFDIDSRRQDIVCAHLKAFAGMVTERAKRSEESAEHAEKNPHVWGKSTPEMVERFRGMAAEDMKGVAWNLKLVAKIDANGLPPECLDYLPEALQEKKDN